MKNIKNHNSYYLISNNGVKLEISKSKTLIGNAPNCDINLIGESISFYHTLIQLSESHIQILDLFSKNGTYVNGVKVNCSKLEHFDRINIGVEEFTFICDKSDILIEDVDCKTETVLDNVFIETDILPDNFSFQDQNFMALTNDPLKEIYFQDNEFISLDSIDKTFDITSKNEGKVIKITKLINGMVLDYQYLGTKDGTYFCGGLGSKAEIKIDLLSNRKVPFLKIKNSHISVLPLNNFTGLDSERTLLEDNVIILNHGSFQIFIEIENSPNSLITISSLTKERDFYKQSIKTFSSILLPMLFLLFVDFSIPEPEKKLSIIYRQPEENKPIPQLSSSKNLEETTKISKVEKTKIKSKVNETKKIAIKNSQKIDPYSFNIDSKNLFANTSDVISNGHKTQIQIQGKGHVDIDTKISSEFGKNSARMGSRNSNLGTGDLGFTGLAGNDTAYVEPKTVILGSMDPELLRKILRQYIPQFKYCYQQELISNSDQIKGIIDLNFEITSLGKVAKIDIKTKDAKFSKNGTNCMAKVLAIIDFPRPKGGGKVAVRQPLNFFAEKERG